MSHPTVHGVFTRSASASGSLRMGLSVREPTPSSNTAPRRLRTRASCSPERGPRDEGQHRRLAATRRERIEDRVEGRLRDLAAEEPRARCAMLEAPSTRLRGRTNGDARANERATPRDNRATQRTFHANGTSAARPVGPMHRWEGGPEYRATQRTFRANGTSAARPVGPMDRWEGGPEYRATQRRSHAALRSERVGWCTKKGETNQEAPLPWPLQVLDMLEKARPTATHGECPRW